MAQLEVDRLASWIADAEFEPVEMNPEEDNVEFVHFRILGCIKKTKEYFFLSRGSCCCPEDAGPFIYTNTKELFEDFDNLVTWQKQQNADD